MPLKIVIVPCWAVSRAVAEHDADFVLSVMADNEYDKKPGGMAPFPNVSIPRKTISVSDIGCCQLLDDPVELAEIAAEEPSLTIPTIEHAEAIIAVSRNLIAMAEQRSVTAVYHFQVGASRSPAAAMITLAVEDGPGNEVRTLQRLKLIKPNPLPNANLIKLADQALKRNGTLFEAWKTLRKEADDRR